MFQVLQQLTSQWSSKHEMCVRNLWIKKEFKYVLSTMGVSKESISKFLIGNRFHVKLRILSPYSNRKKKVKNGMWNIRLFICFDVCTRHELHRPLAHTVCTTQIDNSRQECFVTALGVGPRDYSHNCSLTRKTSYNTTFLKHTTLFIKQIL